MGTWNYRVIEFVGPPYTDEPNELWRAIHEVYYDENGHPVGYTESPAVIAWHPDEDDIPFAILERMREALAKPVLVPSDFHTEQTATKGCGSTRKSE